MKNYLDGPFVSISDMSLAIVKRSESVMLHPNVGISTDDSREL